jgi:hypothetical protein
MIAFCALCTAWPTQAAVVTLSPTADTRILNFFPLNPFGDDSIISVFNAAGNNQRTLMSFDLSVIPAGQQITSAILTLTAGGFAGNNDGGLNMDVHAVTTPWVENQATWLLATPGNPWVMPGGDFDPFVYATSTAKPLNGEKVTWDLTNLVQVWYDGSIANEGLLLKSFEGNALTFFSNSPQNLAESRPSLTIEYAPIPEANSLVLGGVSLLTLGVVSLRRRTQRVLANP